MTAYRTKRLPVFERLQDGTEIVRVSLAGGAATAIVESEDYHRLMASGVGPNWCLNRGRNRNGRGTVRASRTGASGNLVGIARLLLKPKRGRIVCFRDGDPTNLLRRNLWEGHGYAWRDDEKELARPAAAKKKVGP